MLSFKQAGDLLLAAIDLDERKDSKSREYYDSACEAYIALLKRPDALSNAQRVKSLGYVHAALERLEALKSKRVRPDFSCFDEVIGLTLAKRALTEAIVLPITHPSAFLNKRRPATGVLLYGPPGTGKSFLAEKVVKTMEGSVEFFGVSASDVVSKYSGESARNLRQIFEEARKRSPSVVFVDEIDSIGRARGENDSSRALLTELLTQMDGFSTDSNSRVTVVCATNDPGSLDSALRRRFQKRIFVGLPRAVDRAKILDSALGRFNEDHSLTRKDVSEAASQMDGFSSADVVSVAKEAHMLPVRDAMKATHFKKRSSTMWGQLFGGSERWVPCSPNDFGAIEGGLLSLKNPELYVPELVTASHVARALEKTKASVSESDLAKLEAFRLKFGEKVDDENDENNERELVEWVSSGRRRGVETAPAPLKALLDFVGYAVPLREASMRRMVAE